MIGKIFFFFIIIGLMSLLNYQLGFLNSCLKHLSKPIELLNDCICFELLNDFVQLIFENGLDTCELAKVCIDANLRCDEQGRLH